MKLQTSIPARLDGTVVVEARGDVFVFKADAAGALSCDVSDDQVVAELLAGGHFFPENPDDYAKALSLDDDADDDDADHDETGAGDHEIAPPVEANTPPSPSRGRKARG